MDDIRKARPRTRSVARLNATDLQRRCADYLNSTANSWSSGRKMLVAGVLMTTWIFYCGALVMGVRIGGSNGISPFQISTKPQVNHIVKTSGTMPRLDPVEQERFQSFRQYLDSLHRATNSTRLADSLERARPGLLDSLAYIENFYRIPRKHNHHEKTKDY